MTLNAPRGRRTGHQYRAITGCAVAQHCCKGD